MARIGETADPLIMVVDDDIDTLEMMECFLDGEGYRTVLWHQATGAHEIIRKEQPNLVILDLRMEQRDAGWTILEQMRADPATAHIPAIMYSGSGCWFRAQRETLLELNCDALEKPFELAELQVKIDAALGQPREA